MVAAATVAVALSHAIQGGRAGLGADQLGYQVVLLVLEPLVLWIGGSAFAYMVGASFFRGPATQTDFAEVLRTTGFAFTPGLLLAGSAVPGTAGLWVFWSGWLWIVVAGVIAIRQALDFTTLRAIGTFGTAAVLLWLLVWGLAFVPLPL